MRTNGVISDRTWLFGAAGAVVSLVCLGLIRGGVGASASDKALIGNLPSVLTGWGAAGAALWGASRFGRGEPLHRQWLLIALGMSALALGDTLYAYFEVFTHEVPFPSVADVAYLVSFPLFGCGIIMALLGFRRSMDLRQPLLIAALCTLVVTIALWASVFAPVLSDARSSVLEKVLSVLYPVGDLWLLLFPALGLSIALSRLAGGRLAWPWWAIVTGVALVAVADTLFTLLDNAGAYSSGSFIDVGWWLGYTAIAVGASLAVDVQGLSRKGGHR